MPPAAIRRPLTITAWTAMSILCLALAPLLLALAAVVSGVSRRPQPLILTRLIVVYFACELLVLLACGALWLGSGAGVFMGSARFQAWHYGLLRWFVRSLTQAALSLLDISVAPELSPDATRALKSSRPLLLFSRHAGPGDTFLLIDRLLTDFKRLPSVVFKESLVLDPCVDLIAHRLPHAVLDTSEGEECEARIQTVASGLLPDGVLLLFPEGGNFTSRRRRRAISKLWRIGHRGEAAAAERLSHVLPPRPGGALAALRGNPTADVVFAAHTGLGLAAFPRELWDEPPIGRTLKTRMWLAPAADRPSEPEAQVRWLYEWWERLDTWIQEKGDEAPEQTDRRGLGVD